MNIGRSGLLKTTLIAGLVTLGGCSYVSDAGDMISGLWPFGGGAMEDEKTMAPPPAMVMADIDCAIPAQMGGAPELAVNPQNHLLRAVRLEQKGEIQAARTLYLWLTTAEPNQPVHLTCDDVPELSGTVAGLAAQRLARLEAINPQANTVTAVDIDASSDVMIKDEMTSPTTGDVQPVGTVAVTANAPLPQLPEPEMMSADGPADEPLEQIAEEPQSRFIPLPDAQIAAIPVKSGYAAQLASYRNAREAQHGWGLLKTRYAAALQDQSHEVVRADLGPRGIFYRVMITGFDTVSGPAELCDKLIRSGADCIIREPAA